MPSMNGGISGFQPRAAVIAELSSLADWLHNAYHTPSLADLYVMAPV
jgi:hypothetical protein